jgi:dolichol-phosphate mannosyltransferase
MNPEFSVVVPVCNEAENVEPLAREIAAAMAGRSYEMIFIDDGSTDETATILLRLKSELPTLRVLRHSFRSGQSAAVASGVRAARGPWIATLDGDGQNDPADIPRLIAARDQQRGVQLFMGNRKASRQDTAFRKLQSSIANGVRSGLLGDDTPDTGCGIKLFAREVFMDLPRFDHMHRFLPALFMRQGARVVSIPVGHRPRTRGTSKYGMLNRVFVGITDMLGVMWLQRRNRRPRSVGEEG